jgi:hypothetical protein
VKAIDPGQLLTEITDPKDIPVCIHGAYKRAVHRIKEEGLSSTARQMVCCAAGFPKDDHVISGMGASCGVAICIDAKVAVADKIRFCKGSKMVLLTSGLKWFIHATYLRIDYLQEEAHLKIKARIFFPLPTSMHIASISTMQMSVPSCKNHCNLPWSVSMHPFILEVAIDVITTYSTDSLGFNEQLQMIVPGVPLIGMTPTIKSFVR